MDIHELMNRLLRPMFIYRMHGPGNPHGHASAREKAAKEIDQLVRQYCKDNPEGE